jgi:hypothetical protein
MVARLTGQIVIRPVPYGTCMGGDLASDASSTNWPDASPAGLQRFPRSLGEALKHYYFIWKMLFPV